MARVIKVVINGREVEVHVQDGGVERILTFGDTVREQVSHDGIEVKDSDSPYGDLFGTQSDLYDDEEYTEDDLDDDDDDLYEDDDWGDHDDEEEDWDDDDVVGIIDPVVVTAHESVRVEVIDHDHDAVVEVVKNFVMAEDDDQPY
jgi:hypothetical protein